MLWIELVMSFGCNCNCQMCPASTQTHVAPMSPEEIHRVLKQARARGAQHAWFGGGEPSLHPDLMDSLERTRSLGYERIRIQTNGMRFSYLPFARRCITAGATEFGMSIKGADADSHDAVTRTPGSFARMTEGIRNLVALGKRVEGDVLITAASMAGLDQTVERFAMLGVSGFTFWLVSLHGLDAQDARGLLPRLSELAPHLDCAFDAADRLGVTATSLHTPPCVLTAAYRDRYLHSGAWDLAVVTPGADPFPARDSPMEGGAYLEACSGCTARPACLGPRKDYLEVHGSGEFVPL